MKKLTNQNACKNVTNDTRDADDEFVESYGVSVDEHKYAPKLTDKSICVNCDKLKSCSNICMDCIKKIVEENRQSALTDEQIEKWVESECKREPMLGYSKAMMISTAKAYRDGKIAEWVKNAT